MEKIVHSHRFDLICISMIIFNTVLLGVVTQLEALDVGGELPLPITVIGRACSIWFFLELIVRFIAAGPYMYFFSAEWTWNMLDLCIVASDVVGLVVEIALSGNEMGASSTTFRVLRTFRAFRAFRVLRLGRFFKELRLMVLSVLRSGILFFWSALLLGMLMYVCGIFLTQAVTQYLHDTSGEETALRTQLQRFFTTLDQSVYTLFLTISGGISWHEVSDPLLRIHAFYGLFFVFYIFFAVFSLLNIITAVFVDCALSSAKQDQEEVIQAHLQDSKQLVQKLVTIFASADADHSHSLSLQEFEAHLSNPKVVACLNSIGIPVDEAPTLYKLLDVDDTNTLTAEDFVFGCLKLKGPARTYDLQTLMCENKKLLFGIDNRMKRVVEDVGDIANIQNLLHNRFDEQTKARALAEVSEKDVHLTILEATPKMVVSPHRLML